MLSTMPISTITAPGAIEIIQGTVILHVPNYLKKNTHTMLNWVGLMMTIFTINSFDFHFHNS